MLQLEPRLALLASLVPAGAHLADVGTDHAYLPVYLLQQGRIAHAIASDINADPLMHAKRTAQQYEITAHIEFRLCAGLDAISESECDCIAIAGMGGETIIKILEAAPWTKDKTLLLQPMTKGELLRPWLAENGYRIERETLVRDKGTIYAVLTVRGGKMQIPTMGEAFCGVMCKDDVLYGEYAAGRIAKLDRAIDGLQDARLPDRAARIEELQKIKEELEKSREEWKYADSQRD